MNTPAPWPGSKPTPKKHRHEAPVDLRTEPVGPGHIAGVCASLGFDARDVVSIYFDRDVVVVETLEHGRTDFEGRPVYVTHEIPIRRYY